MTKKVKELQIHDKDTGSSEVQIAQLTGKIESLSKHIKQFKKDKHSSVGLLRAVNRRKKLLDYLKKNKIEDCLFVAGSKINYDNELLIRNSGCAALDMAYVASGRYDGYFQKNINLWDIAAGIIIVEEAGGILNEINLSNINGLKIIASNNNINNELIQKLKNF